MSYAHQRNIFSAPFKLYFLITLCQVVSVVFIQGFFLSIRPSTVVCLLVLVDQLILPRLFPSTWSWAAGHRYSRFFSELHSNNLLNVAVPFLLCLLIVALRLILYLVFYSSSYIKKLISAIQWTVDHLFQQAATGRDTTGKITTSTDSILEVRLKKGKWFHLETSDLILMLRGI